MALFNVGMLIGNLRKARKMTQEQLAEGICDRSTITKIEKGTRKPDWFTFRNIMYRLGEEPEEFFSSYADKNEMLVLEKHRALNDSLWKFDYKGLKIELDELEKNPLFAPPREKSVKKTLGYLIFLRFKACLHQQGEYKDPPLALKYILEAIKYTRPDFAIDKIPDYFLAPDEFHLLNTFASILRDTEGMSAAINVWLKLKDNYERGYALNQKTRIAYRDLVVNISISLKLSGRYEECLEMATEGIATSQKNDDMRAYSRFLYQKAFCLMKLGKKEEGRALYKKFLMFAYVLDGYANISFETVKKEFEDVFGEEAPSFE